MIQELERRLLAGWERLAPARPPPARLHFLKLASEDYPDAGVPLLLFAFAPGVGEPVAVAKVARDAAGDAGVAAEAAFLLSLHARLPEPVAAPVPRLLHQGLTNGRAFLIMTAVPGELELHNTWGVARARRAAARIDAALLWAWSLAQSAAGAPISCGAWIGDATLAEFLSAATAPVWERRRRDALEKRLLGAWDTAWPAGAAHGDFFPGNVLFQGERLTGVVDWAHASQAAPCCFDVLTYETSFAMQVARAGRGPDAGLLRDVGELQPFRAAHARLRPAGVDADLGGAARAATLLALYRTAARHGRTAVCQALARILAATLDAA